MKKLRYIITVGMALFLIGCPIRSVSPLFTEKNLVFNPGLVGAWIEKEKQETYFFQKASGKNYLIILCNGKGDTSQYIAQLGQLGKSWFLDSFPREEPMDYQMIPTHIISKIWLNEDTLIFASLEGDHIKMLMETQSLKIEHASMKDDIFLTASTDELQQLVLQLEQDDKAFLKPIKLIRMK